jgi:hypothetical protein
MIGFSIVQGSMIPNIYCALLCHALYLLFLYLLGYVLYLYFLR